ncbi:MAG: DUF4340 domain-containing protein [Nitrospirales bacterium]|nr:DUF4340 domain-containing protein [Nitrospirales bacterium]
MKPKTLMILAGITFVVILGAVLLSQDTNEKPSQSGELVFPDLMAGINEIEEMTIESKDHTVTLVRQGERWSVKEKGGYAASFEKVKPVLIGMAELRIREPKTKNPDLYEKLGLQDHNAEGSPSTLITLKAKGSKAVASMLLGNQRPGRGNPTQSDLYIRKPDDPQTWLVSGKLPVEKVPGEWLEKELLNIAGKRIQRVSVTHPGGETLTIYKDTPDALDFKVRDLPKDQKVNSQFNVNNVANAVAQLTLEDVKKSDEPAFSPKAGLQAVLETFDGLRLTVETMNKDEVVYGRIAAAFDPTLVYKEPVKESSEKKADVPSGDDSGKDAKESDESDTKEDDDNTEKKDEPKESILKSEEDVQKEVADLNAKFKDWIFEFPKFKVENFSKKKDDLIAKE